MVLPVSPASRIDPSGAAIAPGTSMAWSLSMNVGSVSRAGPSGIDHEGDESLVVRLRAIVSESTQ